jgi:hypothetical protein
MLNKIYLCALVVFIIIMSFLTYFSHSWLGSITNPKDVAANYLYYANISWYFLWISTIVLLITANLILWNSRRFWAFLTTFFYFAVFTILQTFWLDNLYSQYLQKNLLATNGFSLKPLLGAFLCIGVGVLIFLNQFLVIKMHDKMLAKTEATEREIQVGKTVEETTSEIKN